MYEGSNGEAGGGIQNAECIIQNLVGGVHISRREQDVGARTLFVVKYLDRELRKGGEGRLKCEG
jgi:hypothetical protein